jgi:pilus assembly protein CpaB
MIKSQALGGKSNKTLIFLGLFLGVVSAVLVVVYLSQAGGGGSDVSGAAVTPVVVVKDGVPVGARITEDMVTLKSLSTDAVLADAYRDTGDVVGQVARVPMVAGEQVVPSKVTATGAAIGDVENPPLAYVVEDGMRAVAVQVDSQIAASGLIRPGDYVDVILTVKVEGGGATSAQEGSTSGSARDQIARTILQNVQVLSIDQNVARTVVDNSQDGEPVVADSSDTNPDATTVTLAVSPAHGEVLTVAETCGQNFGGRLALALRAFGDESQVQTRSVWPNDGSPPTCAGLLGLSSLQ